MFSRGTESGASIHAVESGDFGSIAVTENSAETFEEELAIVESAVVKITVRIPLTAFGISANIGKIERDFTI